MSQRRSCLFGSLGLARAGLKTFIASLNFSIIHLNIHGAFMLSNMGLMQLIIQRRITTLSRRWLSRYDDDKTGDSPSGGARRLGEIDVLESDKKGGGPGRADDHDLEQGLEPTGASHRDENVSVANTAPGDKGKTATSMLKRICTRDL